jgi:hypothetical protein
LDIGFSIFYSSIRVLIFYLDIEMIIWMVLLGFEFAKVETTDIAIL